MLHVIVEGAKWLIGTEAGQTILMSLAGLIGAKLFRKNSRQRRVLELAERYFWVVEELAKRAGWDSKTKYLRLIERVTDALLAAGEGQLTAQEVLLIQKLAGQRAQNEKGYRVQN